MRVTKSWKMRFAVLCVSTAVFGCGGEAGEAPAGNAPAVVSPMPDPSEIIMLPSTLPGGEQSRSASVPMCLLGQIEPQFYYPLDGRIGHSVGYWEAGNCHDWGCEDTWAVNISSEVAGHMWYGPYDRSYGVGRHTAVFAMDIDNAATGSDVVATIDVAGGVGGRVYSRTNIRRDQMKDCQMGSGKLCYFGLALYDPCFDLIETRVYYNDTAALRVYWTSVQYDKTQPWPYAAEPTPREDR
ncbi:hypothetical protein JRI60_31020 [Archangium violaceum]|uniref:hypothetical protein n=1 Tax=Archangium violaceum TaxID=83451 RepID=UPI0019514791|nr:hypothetical protein [Archangium violaceum]QRN93595.1 hypothetical protein JRI60_31020 [Archangium violaceum]